jgi:hypothetical protein
LNEREAFDVLLVRAAESLDSDGVKLSYAVRQSASADAARELRTRPPASGASVDRFMALRAARLVPAARDAFPELGALRRPSWPRWLPAAVALLGVLVGIASNALGETKRINLITAPIAFLIGWNVLVYVLMIVCALRRAAGGRSSPGPIVRWLAAHQAGVKTRTAAPALREALAAWIGHGQPLHSARIAAALHLGAAGLAAGAVLGMYLRGVGVEFLAGWESTFLEPGAVHRLLSLITGPGALLTGMSVPDAVHIAAIRFHESAGGELAAPWIHRYAASAVVIILGPRLLLAAIALVQTWRLARHFPLPLGEDYFRRLAAGSTGRARRVTIIPYSVADDAHVRQKAMAGLERMLGIPVEATFHEPLKYGDALAAGSGGEPHDRVLVFSLAATPEPEVHGELLEPTRPLAVLVDEAAFAARFTGDAAAERRLEERRNAWREFLAGFGIEPVFLVNAAS